MNIYADNAATTRMSRTAIDAMLPCMEEVYGNPSTLYQTGQRAKEVIEQARDDIAAVINLIVFMLSVRSSESNQSCLMVAAYMPI